jgi:shikimate kinase
VNDVRNIVLVGFMGAGKTSAGKALADVLHRPFFDTDVMVEEGAGATVETIFETLGEDVFRTLESEAIATVAAIKGSVIATGGGALKNQASAAALKKNNFVVYLKASPQVLLDRITNQPGRPLATAWAGVEDLSLMLAEREASYEAIADLIVDTSNKTPDEVRHEVFHAIGY